MRDIHKPINLLNIIKLMQTWRQTSMQTENSTIDCSGQRLGGKDVCELFPDSFGTVLLEALVVEPVDFVDFITFVISS